MTTKPLVWVGACLGRLRAFPAPVRREAGYQLYRVQSGLHPADWKPLPGVGPGVAEIRIHERGEYRVIYLAKFTEAVYVLHACSKKTRKARQADLEAARRGYADVVRSRRKE